ncbi:MAG: hypothetical protein F4X02_14720 [Chloroflexi bacterium]|nr:hypothetical protein [Chloroflexota bacterium]
MTATVLRILSRHREHPGVIASLADFEWTAADMMTVHQLFDDPRYTLYCLDGERELAIFTALPAGVDLTRTPFMYQAQFDQAESLAALPFADFIGFADSYAIEREPLLFLHNIGRCGSTALCRALNEIDGVMALSEPEALSNMISLRHTSRDWFHALIHASLAWLCRAAVNRGNGHYVFKLRNQASVITKPYIDALPEARHLFMYRNVIDWLASFHRLRAKRGDRPTRYTRQQVIEQQAAYYQQPAAEFEGLAPPALSHYLGLEGRALGWLYMLGVYLDLRETGWPISALRYEDLQANRDAVLAEVARQLGVPAESLAAARRAFASDAQAGTVFARDGERGNTVQLPAEMQATVRRLLALQPVIRSADYVLPGTLLH